MKKMKIRKFIVFYLIFGLIFGIFLSCVNVSYADASCVSWSLPDCTGKCAGNYAENRTDNYGNRTDNYGIGCIENHPELIDPPKERFQFRWFQNLFSDVLCDYSIYYGKENLTRLGGVFLVSGVLANTNMDRSIRNMWQEAIRSKGSNQFFKLPCAIGKFSYFRVYLGGILLGHWFEDSLAGHTLYRWGYRALRTMLLISPQEVFYSWALGSGRPEDHQKSKWRFFGKGGNASCSGHAFNGAVPFLTAAMMTDDPALKYSLYALSVLPGLSKINSDRHYLSQVVLGWSLAFLCAKVVDEADEARAEALQWRVVPVKGGVYMQAGMRF